MFFSYFFCVFHFCFVLFFLFLSYFFFFFFFFFQAEDGIRDGTVTGVQTCALPIWYSSESHLRIRPASRRIHWGVWRLVGAWSRKSSHAVSDLCRSIISPARSEERRVGKECRSRWSPYQ